ncbi:glycosyltransferase family 4 protein [Methylomonas sp. 2BW1-5-20]|uniref:glycosyltransferase family 4 protein n=1 Tax=Methylomonas sp. 2BW1-5-20 TaxID=3376686 RepID=UPI0040522D70
MDIKTIGLVGPIETASFQDILSSPGGQPYPKGLGGSPVNLMARELYSRGYNLILYSLDREVKTEVTIKGERLTIHFGPYRRRRALDFFAAEIKYLAQAILKNPPDFLHAHWTYEFALAAQATKLPHLVTSHDVPFNILKLDHSPYRIIRTLMGCKAIWKTRYLSAVAPYVAENLKRQLFYRRTIRVIPNGMPDGIFNRPKSVKSTDAPLTFATILVGWSGRKNGEAAIEAFALTRKHLPNCRLIMFGSGHGINEEAELWAKSRGFQEGIEFVGQHPYEKLIQRIRDEVDILVHPALEEAQPMALIEPMAMGIPVIAGQSSGGVPWTLGNGDAGVLVDITQPQQIADAMLSLANNNAERLRVGLAGLALAKQRFHIGVVTDAYLQAYNDILTGLWK